MTESKNENDHFDLDHLDHVIFLFEKSACSVNFFDEIGVFM
jgi:hypothetical protein